MANLDEACCSEEMATPPSLMQLCEHVLASLLNRDLGFWKQVQGLPLDVIHRVLLCLPPLTLQSLSNQHVSISRSHNEGGSWSFAEMPSTRGDECELVSSSSSQARRWKGDNRRNDNARCCKRKRDYTGRGGELDSSTLVIGIPLAWKSLYGNRWPRRSRRSPSSEYGDSDCDKGEDNVDADWQQLYWEAHLQECLNAAAAQASVSSYECQVGDIMLPSDLVNKLSSSGREDNELSTLRGNCKHFAHYARKLRLQSVLCTPELVVLLEEARLRSISIYNVRIRSDLTGLCQLLAHSIPTLQRLEFYHSKFSGSTLNKIGRAMSPADTEHRLQHFALISSRIFDQTDLFLVKPPDFLHFLCAARWLRSLRLWDNSLEQENVVFIMNIIFHLSKNFSFLHLVDNELGELFTRLLANTLVSSNTCDLEAPPGLHRLTVLDLRSNMLDGEAVRSLAMCLKKMPKLEHLNLSDNPLEDSGIEGLVPYLKALCNGTSSLTILSLATCRMTASGATALLDALSLSQITIRRLSIASNHLGSSVSTSLAKFLRKCALEALDISDIGLGPTGCSIELQEAMISNKTILQFDISKNRISAPGAAMLASVIAAGCTAFTSINASANLLSVDSITSIATALQSQSYRQSAETIMLVDLRENPGSFLCKLAGIYDHIGRCAVLLSDSSNELQPVFHDDDP